MLMFKDRKEINFNSEFDKCDNVLSAEYSYEWSDGSFKPNLSSILTILIQHAGRYCEHYASDLFVSWEEVLTAIKNRPEPGTVQIFPMGFRRNGVDHEEYIRNSEGSTRYRCLLAVKLTCSSEERIGDKLTIILKDLTNELSWITD